MRPGALGRRLRLDRLPPPFYQKPDGSTSSQDSPEYEKIVQAGKAADLLKWTDESAAKIPVGGGSSMKTAQNLGDHVRKCMVWEIWHRVSGRIIWFIREASGVVLRVDPDYLQLAGFYPIPIPMLAVTTSDSRIPKPFYDLYARLAEDLDETSHRISALTRQIKIRGGFNAANSEVADILRADDGKMIPLDGVDLMSGGLQNHIWLMPIQDFMMALKELYLARDQIKNAIYEVMGISDIMRGATKASETATAQRIKGSMGVSRLEDQKQAASNFVRDLLRLKAEIIAQNFDAETLAKMTGEDVTPEVMEILRSDFMRTCSIDIETDSTVVPDLQAEQEGMAMIMQSVQLVMQGTQGLLMTGILPPPQVMQLGLELLKMALHPVRFSRGVVEMIDTFQKQLASMPVLPPPMMGPPGLAAAWHGRPATSRNATRRTTEDKRRRPANATAPDVKGKKMAKEPEKNDEPKTKDKTASKAEDAPQLEPYRTGSPPDPEDQFFAAHGFRREAPKKEK